MTLLDVTVEIPRGSRNKYVVDHVTGRIRLESTLFTEMVYPADYGFIENTLGPDGDPLDALVLLEEPTYPGVGVTVRAVGVFLMKNAYGNDPKIITVPATDPRWAAVVDVGDIPAYTRDAVAHFFEHYKDLEPEQFVTAQGFGDRAEAQRIVSAATHSFRSNDSYES